MRLSAHRHRRCWRTVCVRQCTARITRSRDVSILVGHNAQCAADDFSVADPIKLSIFGHRFMGIAEQMGRALQRTRCRMRACVRAWVRA
jgi:hypothetical protein